MTVRASSTTGTGFLITDGGYSAGVAAVGASLSSLMYRGRDLIVPFDPDAPRPAMRGAVLAPWPNRLANGRYRFADNDLQLPVSEPATGTSVHGLVAGLEFTRIYQAENRLILSGRIEPQPGYPWRVRIDVDFRVDEHGFRQKITATNEAESPAPVGLGVHPYLLAGACHPGAVNAWSLKLPARTALLVSADRLLPAGIVEVDEFDSGILDFRRGRVIGSTELNHAFTSLDPTDEGEVAVRLVDDEGQGVQLSWDASAPWVQVYSADRQEPDSYRHALAVEPMTCPPDAFNSGRDLRIIPPGGQTTLGWRLQAV